MKNLVVFKASWCQPCKQLEKTMQDMKFNIPVSFIDIDSDVTATNEYSIRGVPTLLIIEDNQVIKRKSGSMTAKQLEEFVE